MGHRRPVGSSFFLAALLLAGLPGASRAQDGGEDAAPGVEDNRYVSPTYGFSLGWDDAWRVESAASDGGTDELRLTNGTSTVALLARPFAGDPTACVEEAAAAVAADAGAADFAPALDGNGQPLAGSDDLGAYASYNYTADGEQISVYLDCRPLVPGEAALLITQTVPLAAYNDELAARSVLLDGLDLTRSSAPDPSVTVERGGESDAPASFGRVPFPAESSFVGLHDDLSITLNAQTLALSAIDITDGRDSWSLDTGMSFGQALAHEGVVYTYGALDPSTAGPSTAIIAADADSGQPIWTRKFDSIALDVMAPGNLVYARDGDGDLYALRREDGREQWSFPNFFPDPVEFFSAKATIEDGLVAVVFGATVGSSLVGQLVVLNAEDGQELWRRQTFDPGGTFSLPTFVGDVVVVDEVVGEAGFVYGLDAESGDELWRTETGMMVEYQIPAMDGLVYVADIDGSVFAIDAQSGEEKWVYSTDQTEISEPAVMNGTVYVSGDGHLSALDAVTGALRWRLAAAQPVGTFSAPVTIDGTAYVGNGVFLSAVDETTGAELWRVRTEGRVYSVALARDGRLFVNGSQFSDSAYVIEPASSTSGARDVSGPSDEAVDETSLLSAHLQNWPAGPAFVGLWRLTFEPGARATLPTFWGPAVAYVESGSLSVVGGLPPVPEPLSSGGDPKDPVAPGDRVVLPIGESRSAMNEFDTPAVMLVAAVVPEGSVPEGNQEGPHLRLLAGGVAEVLPGGSASLGLHLVTVNPGADLVPILPVWPELIVVESGAIELSTLGGEAEVTAAGDDPMDAQAARLEAGDAALIRPGTLRVVANADEGPLQLLVLGVGGDVQFGGNAGGCGGRCLTRPR